MSKIIESYENYREEDRLTTNNARRVEFITSLRAIKEAIPSKAKILDVGAGTGVYAFELAKEGHDVTASDITPRHVEVMKQKAASCDFAIKVQQGDATNLSQFEDGSFDVVLCMGPFYHIVDEGMRRKCLEETRRVLEKGGTLVLAYINRHFIIPEVVLNQTKYMTTEFITRMVETGVEYSDNEDCFWTDAYFSTPEEIENYIMARGYEITDHLGADGLSPILCGKVDRLTEDEFEVWCEYHYAVCRVKSTLGNSNHGLIMAKK